MTDPEMGVTLDGVPTRDVSGRAFFACDGGYEVTNGGDAGVGSTRNLGTSVQLKWRDHAVAVNHLDLLRAYVANVAPEDLAVFDSMMEEQRRA